MFLYNGNCIYLYIPGIWSDNNQYNLSNMLLLDNNKNI